MTRILRAGLALLGILTLLFGVPAALLVWGSWGLGPLRGWQHPDARLLLLMASWTAAGLWFLTAVQLVADLAAALLGWGRGIRVAGFARPLTVVMVAGLMGLAARPAVAAEPPAAAPSVHVAEAPRAAAAAAQQPAGPVHVVAPGEDLWSIAENLLGDGQRWRALAELNPTAAIGLLEEGTVLRLPEGIESSRPSEWTVAVKSGDSLWSLAEQHLGDGERWPEIAALNKRLIKDPDHIETGWQLVMPAPPPVAASPGVALLDEATPRPPMPHPSALPTPGGPAEPPAEKPTAPAAATSTDPARDVAGQISASLAAGVITGLALLRRQQLAARLPGRRVPHPSGESVRFESALQLLGAEAEELEPTPTSVLVGEYPDGTSVLVDLGGQDITVLEGPEPLCRELIGGIATSLACAPWSHGVETTVAGSELAWVTAFDQSPVSWIEDADTAMDAWEATITRRRHEENEDDDSAEEVYLFGSELTPKQRRRLQAASHPKMHAVVMGAPGEHGHTITVSSAEEAIGPAGRAFCPQLITEPARRALVELHLTAAAPATATAPWWSTEPEDPAPPTRLRTREVLTLPESPPDTEQLPHDQEGPEVHGSPQLNVLGPVTLVGAQGPLPTRAVKQCMEYCGWILQNPGRSSTTMAQSLLVAETTRRSNMSRLRGWLGHDPGGNPYLPEAYTGRITLHPDVTSDWEQLQLLIMGGANRANSQALVDGLTLVRGAPLADAAPGQWHWAEEWRSDMCSTIRDMALVLAGRALDIGDVDTARWAANRALVANPEDELLMGVKVRVAHLTGNRAEVERLALQITRQARQVGMDLHEETVLLLQEVMEGRTRGRQVPPQGRAL